MEYKRGESGLATKLVRADWFRWMPGMAMVSRHFAKVNGCVRSVGGWNNGVAFDGRVYQAQDLILLGDYGDAYPDLHDPATQGCLRAMLDEDSGSDLEVVRSAEKGRWMAVDWREDPDCILFDDEGMLLGDRGAVLARALLLCHAKVDE